MRNRPLGLSLVLAVLCLGGNVASASFTNTDSESGTDGGLSFTAPTLTCSGGLLQSVSLGLNSVDKVADPFGPPGTFKISGYVIERTGANDNNYTTLDTVGLVSTYSDSPGGGLLGTFTYKYRIKATKGTHPTSPWTSPVSNSVSVTVISVLFLGVTRTC